MYVLCAFLCARVISSVFVGLFLTGGQLRIGFEINTRYRLNSHQMVSVVVLWAVKATAASIAFPFFLIVLIAVRIWILPKIFTEEEIEELDNELDDNHFLVDDDDDD